MDATNELSNQLSTIVANPFTAVKLTGVTVTATVTAGYGSYTVDGVEARQNGTWVYLTDGVTVTPGKPLDLRIHLTAYRAPERVVSVRLAVPAGTVTGGSLTVTGGPDPSGPPAATSFAGLLTQLQNAPVNNQLLVSLLINGDSGDHTVQQTVPLDQVASGQLSYPAAS